jgi:uncharacterized membrane protein YdjX (TVP38/TMEM64 family)
VGIAVGVLSAWALYEARNYGVAGFMPRVAATAILGLSVLHTVNGLVFGVLANNDDWHSEQERAAYRRRLLGYLAMVGLVVLAGWAFSFHFALPAFILLFIGITLRRWVLAAILAAVMWVFTYYILGQVLHTAFPPTLLSRWLVQMGMF